MTMKKTAKHANSRTLKADKKPTTHISVPMRKLEAVEVLATGFKMDLLVRENRDGIFSGGGVGSPWITATWKGKNYAVHALDLLAAMVEHDDPAEAKELRSATISGGIGVSASEF